VNNFKQIDLRQTKESAQYLKQQGWLVEKIDQDYIFIRQIPLSCFSIIKLQRPQKINFKKINRLAKKYHAFQINIEPRLEAKTPRKKFEKNGYQLKNSPFLPAKTIQLDLTLSQKQIFKQMKKDARYSIKKAQKEKLQLIELKNLAEFRQAWKVAVNWQRYIPSLKSLKSLKKAFGSKAIFLICHNPKRPKQQDKILAGTVIILTSQVAYYYYAFTSKEGRKRLAQYLLIWETIKLAKKKGCQAFDFEGIYDKRFPIKSWQGFSHFKKSFGGKEIEYQGCFTKYRWPF